MQFHFRCIVFEHHSGRWTIAPLEVPDLWVHASSVERGLEELQIALNDRIERAHPGHVALYARTREAKIQELSLPVLPVRAGETTELRQLRVPVVTLPAHRPYLEVRVPQLHFRVLLQDDEHLKERASHLLSAHLLPLSEYSRIEARPERSTTIVELTVDATPVALSKLSEKELSMQERPPPGSEPNKSEEDEEDEDSATNDEQRKQRTPTLDRLAVALHELAREGKLERAFAQELMVERLFRRVQRHTPEAIVLVGAEGSGKTAVLHELVLRFRAMKDQKHPRKFFHVDASRLVAGEGMFGEWQQQVLEVIEEAQRSRAVLCLGHVFDLLDAGKSAYSDANIAQLLGPSLQSHEVFAIGEATPEEWAKLEKRNASFARVFTVLRLQELDEPTTLRVSNELTQRLATELEMQVDANVLPTIVAMAKRFWPYGTLIGNAAAFVRRLLRSLQQQKQNHVRRKDVYSFFSAETGVPLALLSEEVPLNAATVREFLRARVHSQDEAVERVTEVVMVMKASLQDARKPVAVLFFAGPTGVGKTELAKALSEFLFGTRERLVRLDMGEYAGPGALNRLLGRPGQPGHLVAAVRKQPFGVVLLDELEKAHPAVFDTLLGVLGEGRLTDADGRFADFRNCVIVMTSNLGADTLKARAGFDAKDGNHTDRKRHYWSAAEQFFRPELLNRIDEFVVFDRLEGEAIRSIVERELTLLRKREGLRRKSFRLDISEAAKELLATKGLDPRYGARPLKRTIERQLVHPIAAWMATHPPQGTQVLVADAERNALTLKAQTLASAADDGAEVEALLDDVSACGLDARAWRTSPLVEQYQQRVALFDRVSKLPGYWHDRSLAEPEAKKVAHLRELLAELQSIEGQLIALEELVLEAWYTDTSVDLSAIESELQEQKSNLYRVSLGLYAQLFPSTQATLLFHCSERSAQAGLRYLLQSYRKWGENYGLTMREWSVQPVTERGVTEFKWQLSNPGWEASALTGAIEFSGKTEGVLLASEAGGHRFYEAGDTNTVTVGFVPNVRVVGQNMAYSEEELQARLVEQDIRKYQLSKNLVEDFRLRVKFSCEESHVDLLPMQLQFVRQRALSDTQWS